MGSTMIIMGPGCKHICFVGMDKLSHYLKSGNSSRDGSVGENRENLDVNPGHGWLWL